MNGITFRLLFVLPLAEHANVVRKIRVGTCKIQTIYMNGCVMFRCKYGPPCLISTGILGFYRLFCLLNYTNIFSVSTLLTRNGSH